MEINVIGAGIPKRVSLATLPSADGSAAIHFSDGPDSGKYITVGVSREQLEKLYVEIGTFLSANLTKGN